VITFIILVLVFILVPTSQKTKKNNSLEQRQAIAPSHKHARHSKLKKRSRAMHRDRIPQVIVKVRDSKTLKVIKRTLHDMYVCQCRPGFLGAHCQRELYFPRPMQ